MHVSVTALGSTANSAQGAARDIVDYLSGRSRQPGARKDGPVPGLQTEAGPGSYYADSAESPGRWIGRGAEALIDPDQRHHVDPAMLERVLLGQHPVTGEQLVGARGSAGRTDRRPAVPDQSAAQNPGRLLTVDEVASAAGVDKSHIQRVLRRTEQIVNSASGSSDLEFPKTHLRGIKVDRQWFVTQQEAQRFIETRSEPRVVLGYDLTFSVPKSVSVAWAAADRNGRAVIEHALHQAVDRSLDYVEENGIKVRVGRAQSKGDGMVAAAFLHDTSRELEPQLHVHVVVANMGTTAGGKVQALDGRGLFAHGTTAGHLAEAEIQSILNQQGYRFTPTEKGIAHLEQVPQSAVDAFSTRRTQILDEVGALGVNSPAARQNAAYATRAAKVEGVDRTQLEATWHDTLTSNGMTPDQLDRVTGHEAPLLWTPADTDRLRRFLASPSGVTKTTGIFDRRDVIHSITDYSGGRLTAAEVQRHTDHWLATDAVIPLRAVPGSVGHNFIGRSGRVALAPGTIHYTTPQVVATEVAVTEAYRDGIGTGSGVISGETVASSIADWEQVTGHVLGADQAAMVTSITTSGHSFQAVVGPAGSGKTAALEVAARAWEREGFTVIGASVNGNAAEVLARSTGLSTRTVASLIERLRYDETLPPGQVGPRPLLSAKSVVIVDEASTLSNRDHAELIRHVSRTGATLRTVGDPSQHSSVEAGGAWAAIVDEQADTTPTLKENRRMASDAMADVRLAADDYRNGQIEQALRRLERGDRVVTATTATELLDNLAADWFVDWRRHLADPEVVEPSRMLAENHAVRRELNERAQALLRADGLVSSNGVKIGEAVFHVGDQVMARQQDRNLRPEGGDRQSFVRNGTRGVVVAIEEGANGGPSLIVDFDRRGRIAVPNEFLTKRLRPGVVGGLAPAYAMTTHAAQGDTFDASRAVITDRSSAAGGYVALTRGRNDFRMYAVTAEEFGPPNPAAEHNLPISTDRRTVEDRIEAQLSKPVPTQLATKADPDLAVLVRHGDKPVRELEQAEDPIAGRVARIKLSQAARRTSLDIPDQLAATIGESGDSRQWRLAVTRYAHYRDRFGDDPLHAPPPLQAPDRQRQDHDQVVEALAHARADRVQHWTPAQIAEARRRLPNDSGREPGKVDERTVDHLEQRLARRHRIEAEAVRQADERHRDAQIPVDGRIDPDEAERSRRTLRQAKRDLSRTEAAINDHRALAGSDQPTPQAEVRVAIERKALTKGASRHVERALVDPQPYLTDLVGRRPAAGATSRWLDAARSVETYRVLHLGLGPADGPISAEGSALHRAIGPRPPAPAAAPWDQTQSVVARLALPDRGLPGPSRGLA
jgi:conjugative relaxase-like TrwC/TraI family protein